MKSNSYKTDSQLAIAEAYYQAMLEKKSDAMGKYLHPDVHFISPLAELFGKNAVLESAKNLSVHLLKIAFRSKFSAGNEIMFAYDFIFPEPVGKLRAAVLMEFQDQLIAKIELFFDGKPFEGK